VCAFSRRIHLIEINVDLIYERKETDMCAGGKDKIPGREDMTEE
jgi:hypothetical protein